MLPRWTRPLDRAFNAGIRAINLGELEEAIAAGSGFQVRALLLAGADRTRELLEEDLPPLSLETLKAGGDATVASARARGGLLVREEPVDQDLPPAPGELEPPAESIEHVPVPTAAQDVLTLGFDATNPLAVNWAASHSARLVVEIDTKTRQAITDIVEEAFVEGLPPRVAARRVRPLVGLTSRQAAAVRRMREELGVRQSGFVVRGGVRIPVPPGGFSASQIDRIVSRYAERLHRGRTLNIARTETIRAANEGQRQLWLQARADGLLPAGVKRVWIVTPDDRLCPFCRRMAGQTRTLDEPFDAGRFGRVSGPPAHPQCRCATGIVSADAAAAGTGSTPTIPTTPTGGLPVPPAPRPAPRAEGGARMSWADLPARVAMPRDPARRELVENGLNKALDVMPADLRARAIGALNEIPRVQFDVATASTRSIRRLGSMQATAAGPFDAPRLGKLTMHLSRLSDDVRDWSVAYRDETKRLIARQARGEIDSAERNRLVRLWRDRNPAPDPWRLATEDEFAATLVHELQHALDFQAGTNITLDPAGITRLWRADNMQEQVWRAYYRGEVEVFEQAGKRLVRPKPGAVADERFSYATSKDEEGLAETMRFYFFGDPGTPGADDALTAEQWRESYPELARWFEKNVITPGGG